MIIKQLSSPVCTLAAPRCRLVREDDTCPKTLTSALREVPMNRIVNLNLIVLCAIALSGCETMTLAKTSTINSVTKNFAEVVSSTSTTVQLEVKAKPIVRRDEAL